MLVALNKPYGVLCQFTDAAGRPTLADHVRIPGVYAAGRLDADSEGLLLLTDDGALAHRLTDPRHKTAKTYLVQVEGTPTPTQLAALAAGPLLADGPTRPTKVRVLAQPAWLWPRVPPVRHRRTVPDTWLELIISEGRNRQVRRMTAAVGLPTLRLVRIAIAGWRLDGLAPGQTRVLDPTPAPGRRGSARPTTRPAPARRPQRALPRR